MSQGALSRIEGGLRGMTTSSLKALSHITGYPPTFFSQKRLVYGVGLIEVFHRKRQSVTNRTLDKAYSLIDIRTSEISKLLKGVDISAIEIRSIDINDYDGSAEEVARIVRAGWHLPHGPIQNLTAVLERARGIVIPFDFGTSSIDAISHWPTKMPPLFFVNKYAPTDRLRFTLSHELGHMVMHMKSPNPEIEHQADAFAAEFLMPKKDILPYLSNLSLETLATLKPFWKVSMGALIRRAVDLGTISQRHSRTLWMQMSKAGYRVREPMELDLLPETPTLLKEIVDVHVHNLKYSIPELAKMLHLFEDEVQDIYFNRSLEVRAAIEEAESIVHRHTPA